MTIDHVIKEMVSEALTNTLEPYKEVLRFAGKPSKDKYGYTNAEAMEYMEIGETEIKKLRDSGELPFQFSQGKYRYKKKDMDAYLDKYYTTRS